MTGRGSAGLPDVVVLESLKEKKNILGNGKFGVSNLWDRITQSWSDSSSQVKSHPENITFVKLSKLYRQGPPGMQEGEQSLLPPSGSPSPSLLLNLDLTLQPLMG